MKNVIVRAPLLTMSGYGVHSRQLYKWLEKKEGVNIHSNIVPWGRTSWLLNEQWDSGVIGRIMQSSAGNGPRPDVSFQLQLPNEWDPTLAPVNIGITAAVETDICNPNWIECCNRMTAVVVPSQHTANVLNSSGKITVPLHVVGESFIDECVTAKPIELKLDTKFNFLVLGQLTDHNPFHDRKNVMFTLRWLCEAFADDPDVGIIVKTNSGKGTKIDRRITRNVLQNVVKEIRPGLFPRVHFLHGHMDPDEIAGLYKEESVKALVSATRGEGFGLPLLEAAACDLPVIATNWSGHLDFLNLQKWLKVDYKLQAIPDQRCDQNIFMKGARWAEPSEESFKSTVRKFRKKPEKPSEWAVKLGSSVRDTFSQENICKQYDNALGRFL
ncbi:MAG: hypothetical protein CMA72_09535 [Euryarchaeota archaeon]|nr:hypothetical protein [Euryarchaeota archaeon]|tara:strand:- start:11496 stop:12647 length:1152 start_codon:yes stop_codon:yes gene_type:complete